ncbi:hypothetical protein MY04_06155 [Flammeovirga sp. MY04]|nr:hypothetical protein MY04_06155 [Flammeovirga sp. MY04]
MKVPFKVNYSYTSELFEGGTSKIYLNFTHKNQLSQNKFYLLCKYFPSKGKMRFLKEDIFDGNCIYDLSSSWKEGLGYGFTFNNETNIKKIPFVIEGKAMSNDIAISATLVIKIINEERYEFEIEDYVIYKT